MTAFLSKLFRCLPLFLLVFAGNALPSSTWGCGAQTQASIGYDGTWLPASGYDPAPMPLAGEKGRQTARTGGAFAVFAKLLAAESGGLQLAEGAQQTLAGTQNGILLGTVENGQVNLFQSAAGQIEGHADLLNAGLVSPGAQGFSIGVENGQVTTLFQNSILNPASANYLLPAQTTQQILNTLGATGAKLFP